MENLVGHFESLNSEELIEALDELGFTTLGDLRSYMAELNSKEIQGFALRVENRFPADSTESKLVRGQGGDINNRRDHHQGGGTQVVDHGLSKDNS